MSRRLINAASTALLFIIIINKIDGVKEHVHFLALFELSGEHNRTGWAQLAAARLAIEHINAKALLPNVTFYLSFNDTKCNTGFAIDAFFHTVHLGPNITGVVDANRLCCKRITKQLASITKYFSIMHVSSTIGNSPLNDRERYPTFFRTVMPDSGHNSARMEFIRMFNWSRICTLAQEGLDVPVLKLELCISLKPLNDLAQYNKYPDWNLSVSTAEIFTSMASLNHSLTQLKFLRVNFEIGVLSSKQSAIVVDQTPLTLAFFLIALQLGLTSSNHVWLVHQHIGIEPKAHRALKSDDFASSLECSDFDISLAMERHFWISSNDKVLAPMQKTLFGQSNGQFEESLIKQFRTLTRTENKESDFDWQTIRNTYDAVVALAIVSGANSNIHNNNAIPLTASRQSLIGMYIDIIQTADSYSSSFTHAAGNTLRNNLKKLSFIGATGTVAFRGADRAAISLFHQRQRGYMNLVAVFDPLHQKLSTDCPECAQIFWKDNRVPTATATETRRIQVHFSPWIIILTLIANTICVLWALTLLAFNISYRSNKLIKLSSPNLNNLIIVGCLFVFLGVYLWNIELIDKQAQHFVGYTCAGRIFCFAAGFSFAFGCLFVRTYRIHFICNERAIVGGGKLKGKLMQDNPLMLVVSALAFIDAIVIALWSIMDPLKRSVVVFASLEQTDQNVLLQLEFHTCDSVYYESWITLLGAYKFVLLALGAYTAWEVRKVKIVALNDSRYIAACIYAVSCSAIIVVALVLLIRNRPTLIIALINLFLIVGATTTLSIVFLPKIYLVFGKQAGLHLLQGSNFKIAGNTRRLNLEEAEKKDAYSRAEIHNRIFKQQLIELDDEIERLTLLLEFLDTEEAKEREKMKQRQCRRAMSLRWNKKATMIKSVRKGKDNPPPGTGIATMLALTRCSGMTMGLSAGLFKLAAEKNEQASHSKDDGNSADNIEASDNDANIHHHAVRLMSEQFSPEQLLSVSELFVPNKRETRSVSVAWLPAGAAGLLGPIEEKKEKDTGGTEVTDERENEGQSTDAETTTPVVKRRGSCLRRTNTNQRLRKQVTLPPPVLMVTQADEEDALET